MFSKSSDKSSWIDGEFEDDDIRVLVWRKDMARCDDHPPDDGVKTAESARAASGDNVQLVSVDRFLEARNMTAIQMIGKMDNRSHSGRGKAYTSKEAINVYSVSTLTEIWVIVTVTDQRPRGN